MLDVLRGVRAIAAYLFNGDDGVSAQRRVRQHGLPIKQIGGRIESRVSWLEGLYAEPDAPRASPPPIAPKDGPAPPAGAFTSSSCRVCGESARRSTRGRPPLYHAECRLPERKPRRDG